MNQEKTTKKIVERVTVIPPVPDEQCPGYTPETQFCRAGMIDIVLMKQVSTYQMTEIGNVKRRKRFNAIE